MRQLEFQQFCVPGAICHFATACISQTGPHDPHWHDFIELFWIDSGRGTHWINGQTETLEPGMLSFILEEDRHGFGSDPGESLTLVNVAFPAKIWKTLVSRYGIDLPDLFATGTARARAHRLSEAQLGQIRDAAVELRKGSLGPLALDRFLLNVAWIVGGGQDAVLPAARAKLPAWLAHACRDIENRRHFSKGVWGFYDLCDRSPEHVVRTCRKLLGKTVAELVNDARLNYVATQLTWSDRRMIDIAMDCELDLSRLHRLFRQRYGVSPGVYRRRQQQIITA